MILLCDTLLRWGVYKQKLEMQDIVYYKLKVATKVEW